MGELSRDGFLALTPEELLGPLNDVEGRNAPKLLFIAGNRDLVWAGPRVAVIGARKASEDGIRRSRRLARELAENGVTVVSGLAEGIDTAAHQAAIESGGRTIAVIGTPLDKAYPAANRGLQARLAEQYLVVSQFALGTPTQPKNFPLRNRTMALISHASVIIEAGESSGSLSQGWEALRLGRPLFLLRSIVENPALKWPAQMLDYGASVLSGVDELLDAIPCSDLAAQFDAAF
ncbi:MAG: DNA-protecting protein DprA [Desulfovibrio sp.]|nr:DNA-protecting protein DprA [Desulfovibrio sp.]